MILSLVFLSCKKERGLYDCPGHCKSYVIKGRIFDATTNKAFANHPVKLRWETFRSNCIFCPRAQPDIYNGKTDRNGNFTIVANLDTTLFQDYSLVLSTPEKENFRNAYHGYLEDDNLKGKPVEVPFYPLVNLTIQLTRKYTDVFSRVSVAYSWRRIDGDQQYVYQNSVFSPMTGEKDTNILISAVADLQTNVRVTKSFNGGFVDILDSIVCKQGSDNVMRIEY